MTSAVTPAASTALQIRQPISFLDSWLTGRKPATAKAYRSDLGQFSAWMGCTDLEAAERLIAADRGAANGIVHQWRGEMVDAGLAASTVNRRLSTIRSMADHAETLGLVSWSLNIKSVKSTPYRDTKGPGVAVIREIVDKLDSTETPKAVRDKALVRLLFDRGLRRGEVVALDLADFDPDNCQVWIVPKGRTEREPVTVSVAACDAVAAWLEIRGEEPGPLFTNLDRAGKGDRLTGRSVGRIITSLGESVGVENVRPHGLRHSAITAVLDRTHGDFRAAREFSRHSKIETVAIYDDHRTDKGGDLSNMIADLV